MLFCERGCDKEQEEVRRVRKGFRRGFGVYCVVLFDDEEEKVERLTGAEVRRCWFARGISGGSSSGGNALAGAGGAPLVFTLRLGR